MTISKHGSTLKKEIKAGCVWGGGNQRTYGKITRSSWKDRPGKKRGAEMHSTVGEGAERLSSSARAPYALKIPSLPRSHLYGIRYSNLISPLTFLTFIFIQIG